MKVIHILPYSSLVTGRDFKVHLFADGYHVRTAQQIWKRSKKYQHECWRPERKLKQAITGEKDGITYRAFPSFRPTLGSLDKLVYKGVMASFPPAGWGLWREYSLSLLRHIKKQCQKEKVLIHLYQIPFDLSYLICLYLQNVPILGAHIGGAPYTYSLSGFIQHLPLSLVERKALRNVDMITTGSKRTRDILSKLNLHVILCAPTAGIDFNDFEPLTKEEARKVLGIPLEKRVLLHVGRFYQAKGLDIALKAYEELKSKYDLELIVIGGLKTDPLYDELVRSGAIVREWIPRHELIPYFSAADVYLFPKFYSKKDPASLGKFGGIGGAPIESLACGTPVVGTNLIHFPGNEDELNSVGKIPSSPSDVARCVAEILEHPELYRNCREIVRKYYNFDGIVNQLVDVYDELFDKYYG